MAGPNPTLPPLDWFQRVVAFAIIAVWLGLHVFDAFDTSFEVPWCFDVLTGGVLASIYFGFAQFIRAMWGRNNGS